MEKKTKESDLMPTAFVINHKVVPNSLTKENFWNHLNKKYPAEMKIFCDWIDQYKKREEWLELFNSDPYRHTMAPKFHEIPTAMQIGIFFQFASEQPKKKINIDYDTTTMIGAITQIALWFGTPSKTAEEDYM